MRLIDVDNGEGLDAFLGTPREAVLRRWAVYLADSAGEAGGGQKLTAQLGDVTFNGDSPAAGSWVHLRGAAEVLVAILRALYWDVTSAAAPSSAPPVVVAALDSLSASAAAAADSATLLARTLALVDEFGLAVPRLAHARSVQRHDQAPYEVLAAAVLAGSGRTWSHVVACLWGRAYELHTGGTRNAAGSGGSFDGTRTSEYDTPRFTTAMALHHARAVAAQQAAVAAKAESQDATRKRRFVRRHFYSQRTTATLPTALAQESPLERWRWLGGRGRKPVALEAWRHLGGRLQGDNDRAVAAQQAATAAAVKDAWFARVEAWPAPSHAARTCQRALLQMPSDCCAGAGLGAPTMSHVAVAAAQQARLGEGDTRVAQAVLPWLAAIAGGDMEVLSLATDTCDGMVLLWLAELLGSSKSIKWRRVNSGGCRQHHATMVLLLPAAFDSHAQAAHPSQAQRRS